MQGHLKVTVWSESARLWKDTCACDHSVQAREQPRAVIGGCARVCESTDRCLETVQPNGS